MRKNEMLKIEHYFEALILVILLALFFYVIQSFLIVLILSASLVFMVYPLYKKVLSKGYSPGFTSSLFLIGILALLLIPTYIVVSTLIDQSSELISQGGFSNKLDLSFCSLDVCRTVEKNSQTLENWFEYIYVKAAEYISSSYGVLFTSISKLFLDFFIFIFAFFFLLKDGDKFSNYLKRIFPMKTEYKNALFLRIKEVSNAVFANTLLVAFIQGSLLYLGFIISNFLGADIKAPLFLALIASLFALIPVIGTPIIWFPLVLLLFLEGNFIPAIFLLLYSAIIVGLSDNILKPLLLKKKIEVHSFLILLSILGGIEVFGFVGVFIGPIIVSMLISVLQLYKLDFK